ncbi:hypothetical protein DV515_00003800 [Chloebia gouldiae]|uniref:Uncharacterized protein n=1 Tax=Chloebia gouldiae TaxID=44316 RepID=A0A3L8STH6_CHLGU|nr:hypothetical protein DV515_00003800 [Chloebia gouldiae]
MGRDCDVHEKDSDMHHSVVIIKETVFSAICTMVLQAEKCCFTTLENILQVDEMASGGFLHAQEDAMEEGVMERKEIIILKDIKCKRTSAGIARNGLAKPEILAFPKMLHNTTSTGRVLETKPSNDLKLARKMKHWGSPEPLVLNAGLPSAHKSNTGLIVLFDVHT